MMNGRFAVAAPADYRELARRRLPHFLFEYIDGGSYNEETLRSNITDLRQVSLRQRVLCDVSVIDPSASILGQHFAMPIALGPIGLAGMNARRGEVAAARAAKGAGIPFCLSTMSVCSIAELARSGCKPFWFQMYMIRDRAFMRDLLSRVMEAKCSTLVFTVDMPVPGLRYRDSRSGLADARPLAGRARRFLQGIRRLPWAIDVGLFGRPHALGNLAPVLGARTGLEDYFGWMQANFDPRTTWADLDWVRAIWPGPLVVKGILTAEDALAATKIGANGIVISNHGGRQLDGVPSTARVLPAIADLVRDKTTILIDGGVRSGLDVVRMLALGANGVLLGRAWAYALAAGGQRGIAHMLRLFAAEMRTAMALTGCRSIADIQRSAVYQA